MAIGGVKLAEDTYEALLMANFKPDEAKALMRTPSFQQEVLARLNQIEHVFDKHEESTNELARLWGAIELDPTPITERRGPVQMALTYSSQINEYLDADPERGQKLALALAMIQGPKAVIQLAVSTAIGQTELGQDLNEQYDRAMTRVGTMLAEHMEGGGVVLNGESDSDKFLVGGGKLISSMILGVASGRKGSGGHEAKKPTTTPVELPGGGKGVIDGAKGISSVIEPKIAQQMGKRGWTIESLEAVIANPSKTVVTKDTRFDPVSGTRLNDPATGYIAKDGSYVVRNDRTGAIVQVSDKNDKNWVAPWD
ncbi:hypothetical protein A9L43_20980 [Pseudomonas mosselii]|nr:hypothetical protein A9L43_20980 [Pseudomonas mosselii]